MPRGLGGSRSGGGYGIVRRAGEADLGMGRGQGASLNAGCATTLLPPSIRRGVRSSFDTNE
jgi:hypothetical protein